MKVKWNGKISTSRALPGGGPQGGTLGILEYKSQSDDNTDFLTEKEKYKFIDDLSILEVINLILSGLSSYKSKQQVPSDIAIGNKFINSSKLKTKSHLEQISKWTQQTQMKLNTEKSNYMIFNFSKANQFNTRLHMEENILAQVKQTCLLGVIIRDDLKWHANTASLGARCYKRMTILRNLATFHVPVLEMVNIYCLYIRSVAEHSSVVWSSSLTVGEQNDLERVQKVALRLILGQNYVSYANALYLANLETLKTRRVQLSKRFAYKCTQNELLCDMFPLSEHNVNTRYPEKYLVTKARTNRLAISAIPTMQRQLNKMK